MHRTIAGAARALPTLLAAVMVGALAPTPVAAEGSRQWNADAGTRMHLEYNNAGLQTSGVAIPRRTPVWVYVRAGERLYLGSSANGVAGTGSGAGTGAILVTRRDGTTFTCPTTNPTGANNTVGVIHNRAQERNGPREVVFTGAGADPGATTFYNPCITPAAAAGQDGVWTVEFVSPAPGGGGNPTPVVADADWNGANDDTPQDLATFTVAAWDVSVRNTTNTGFVDGRVYFNYIAINVGGNTPVGGGVNSDLLVQTRDGYRYRADFQGFDPFGAIVYVNNRGFTTGANGTGSPTYGSIALPTTNFYLPTQADNALNTTHKIFLNPPDGLMPTSASAATLAYANANSGWLRPTAAIAPVVDRITLRGIEGSPEAGGSVPLGRAPLGATVGFRTNITGALQIRLDINNDGDTLDPIDRVLTATSPGPATPTGFVTVETSWDGRDGLGNALGAGPVSITVRSDTGLGEFHFPILDAENNSGGFRFDRVAANWTTVESDRMFWNDTVFGGGTSSPNSGDGTAGPAHAWSGGFGNDRGIDTWTFVRASNTQAFSLSVREADLQVTAHALATPSAPVALGATVTYTLTVTNAGPQAAAGARVLVDVPTEITALGAPTCVAAGGATCQAQAFNGNTLEATVDLPVGATATYTYTGTLSARPASGRLTSVAAIQRTADFTDPTATNPDPAPPQNSVQGVRDECNATAAGSGNGTSPACNNLRVAQSAVLDVDVTPSLVGLPTDFTQGTPYSGSVTCTNAGPNAALNVGCVVAGLPPGLTTTCSPAVPTATLAANAAITCTVSGTPSATGSFPVTVTTSADNDGNPDNNVAATSLIGSTGAGAPFGCPANGDAFQVRASGSASLLLRFPGSAFTAPGANSATVVNGSLTPNLNAMGLRETDGFLYALLANGGQPQLYRVGQTAATLVGTIVTSSGQTPALTTGFLPTGGVFDTAGRYFFIGQGSGNTAPSAMYRVDDFSTDVDAGTAGVQLGVAQVYPFVAGSGTTLPVVNVGDIAFGPDGNLYGATQGAVVQFRFAGGNVVVTSRALQSNVGGVGSAFFNGAGSFFVYANGTEQVSEILFDFGAAFDAQPVPVPVVARGTVTATGAAGFTAASDGAACARFTPSDAVAAITLPAVLAPGVPTAGTITCTNNGPAAAQAMTCSASTTSPGVTLSVGACTPPSPATVRALAGENTITCPITVTAEGPNGGANSAATIVATTSETSAVGESNTTNNTATTSSIVLDAVDDTAPQPVPASAGGVAIADVRANDGRGTALPTGTDSTLAQVSTSNPGVTLDPATGAVNVAPNTPPGTYTLVYRLCDAALTSVCDTATATVTVGADIDAIDDAPATVPAGSSGTTASVVANDRANGQPVVLGGSTPNAALTPGAAPATAAGGITMNADGTIAIAPGTTPGTYAYAYTICLVPATSPATCDAATAIVIVGASIDAVDDAPAAVTSAGGSTPSVVGNDTVNGQSLVLAGPGTNATLIPGTAPSPAAGAITLNPDGTITVAAGTTPGTYAYPYTVCVEPAQSPAVCDTATATVVVNAAPGVLACATQPFGSFSNGASFTLRAIDPTTGVSSPLVPPSATLQGTGNSLGITPDGRRAYYVVSQGPSAGQLRYLDVLANTDVDAGVNLGGSRGRMGIAPTGDIGYAGGTGTLQRFTTPASGASAVTALTIVNAAGTPADLLFTDRPGGDLAVAADGSLYLLTRRGGTGANQNDSVLYRAVVAGNTATVSLLGVITPAPGAANANFSALDNNGIAFIGAQVFTAGVRAGLYELYRVDLATLTATFVYAGTAAEQQPIDLGSCSFPTLAPAVAASKVAAVVAPATQALPGAQLEYTITVRNSGDVSASNARFADAIPTGTTYVAGSTTLNGAAVADVGGAFPYATATQVNSPGQPAGVLAPDQTAGTIDDEAVIRFRVTIGTGVSSISNQGTVSFAEGGPVLTDDPAVGGSADPTVTPVGASIDAVDDGPTRVGSASGGSLPTVLGNDRANGQPIQIGGPTPNVTLAPGTAPSPAAGGITMNPDGTITVAPGTTPGTYSYPYTICVVPATTPATCDTATATVVVVAIDAVDDAPTAVGAAGGTTASVLLNDSANGAQATTASVVLTPGAAPSPTSGSITMNADGTITVAPNTTPGTYQYPYTICLPAPDAAVCDTALASVVVAAANPVIQAVDDGPASIPGAGGTTPSVVGNDTVGGQPVVLTGPGTNAALTPGTAPSPASGSITMNPDGTITIAPGTTPGTYTYPYTICVSPPTTPATCSTATATVVVGTPVIDAVDDGPTPVGSATGGTLPTVVTNDRANGQPVVLAGPGANATLTPGAAPSPAAGSITMNPDGTITVAPGTTPGSYSYPYTICLVAPNAAVCSTAVARITVSASVLIDAVDDGPTTVPGTGGTVPTVIGNDRVDGQPVVLGTNAALTPGSAPSPAAGSIIMNPDGTITVAADTTPGAYTYPYTICALPAATPAVCDTAIATVVVAPRPVVDAVDDAPVTVPASGGILPSVLVNDRVNGQPAVLTGPGTNATLSPGTAPTPTAGSITMNPDGTITVAPGTTPGTYTYPYTVCLSPATTPATCDTATATVVVRAVIDAVDDGPVTAPVGGGVIAGVTGNDTLNGGPIVLTGPGTNATLQPGSVPQPTRGAITMNPDGTVTVAPGTTPGTYTYPYTICVAPALSPPVCDTATLTIVVPASIDAIDDGEFRVPGTGGSTPVVIGNDLSNGQPVVLAGPGANATLQPGTAPSPASGSITMNPDGTVTIAPGTTPGRYTYPYTICVAPALTPPVCDTATVTIVVTATIDAVDDGPRTIPASGGTVPGVTGNDTVNGQPLVLTGPGANATLQPGPAPTPAQGSITMNPDGTVTIAPGTTPGTYTYPYTVCVSPPTAPPTCDTAILTIVVTATITAVDDAPPRVIPTGGTLPTIIGNDTVNGRPLVLVGPGANAILLPVTPPRPPAGGFVVNPDGTIIVRPGTTPGRYDIPYTVCLLPATTPATCSTATVTVVVDGLPAGTLVLAKSVNVRETSVGAIVTYTLGIANTGATAIIGAEVLDTPPAGFAYVAGSATIDDADGLVGVSGQRPIRFTGVDVPAGGRVNIRYLMRVGAAVPAGVHTNTAVTFFAGQPASGTAQASVVTGGNADPLFEQARIWGKVFDDQDGDGWQDDGEPGLPGVRLALVEGLVAETDRHGRYHVEGLVLSNLERGQNAIVKLDVATLPPGATLTTENPLLRRLTAGLPTRFDFGVRLPPAPAATREVDLVLGEVVFAPGRSDVREAYRPVVQRIVDALVEYRGGDLVLSSEDAPGALTLRRAEALREAVLASAPAEVAARTRVRIDLPAGGTAVEVGDTLRLGTVLFDTDRTAIRPEFRGLLEAVAARIAASDEPLVVHLTGFADARAPDDYNIDLSRRRASAVADALRAALPPEARDAVRVVADDAETQP